MNIHETLLKASQRETKFVERLQICLEATRKNPEWVNLIGLQWENDHTFSVNKDQFSNFIKIKRNTLNYDFRTHDFKMIKTVNRNGVKWCLMQEKNLRFTVRTTLTEAGRFEWNTPLSRRKRKTESVVENKPLISCPFDLTHVYPLSNNCFNTESVYITTNLNNSQNATIDMINKPVLSISEIPEIVFSNNDWTEQNLNIEDFDEIGPNSLFDPFNSFLDDPTPNLDFLYDN